jgi:MFS family permease
MITISIMLVPIMQGVDTTIANVVLPHMQGSLSAAQNQIAWMLTSYIVPAAIMTPLTGWLAGRFGIKYVFLISAAGFTLASALCGSAASLAQLVIYRLLQGVCGARPRPAVAIRAAADQSAGAACPGNGGLGYGHYFGLCYRSGARRLADR